MVNQSSIIFNCNKKKPKPQSGGNKVPVNPKKDAFNCTLMTTLLLWDGSF